MEYKFTHKVTKNNSSNIIIWHVAWTRDVGTIHVLLLYAWHVMENGKASHDWAISNQLTSQLDNDTCQVTDPITCTLFRPSPLASAPPVTPSVAHFFFYNLKELYFWPSTPPVTPSSTWFFLFFLVEMLSLHDSSCLGVWAIL